MKPGRASRGEESRVVNFPVVKRGRVRMDGAEQEVELRVARMTSQLLARPVGAGDRAWRVLAGWDTPAGDDDPVGAGELQAARWGVSVSVWQPVPRAPLTAGDVIALHAIVDAAARGLTVARVADVPDGMVWGTARHLVTDESGRAFPHAGDDVRDCLLRVTLVSGMEAFWPVAELVGDYHAAVFVTDYRP